VNPRADRLARYQRARRNVAPRSSLRAFRGLVAEALDDLPTEIQDHLENVAVLVEERPQRGELARLGYRADEELLGLYEGINRLQRDSGYHLVTPDRITLFWRAIVDEVGPRGRGALRSEVRKTVIHEVGHHFGMDDAELERLGG
jgi:predicted Zn-dependent protease with MMP-like domain